MSSSDGQVWSRRGLLAAALLGLSACGFQPLYGERSDGQSVRTQLAGVRIAPLPERRGQVLHNLLRNRINPGGQPGAPGYELRVVLSERAEETGLRIDETATRVNVTIIAEYTLFSMQDGRAVTDGRVLSEANYNILENRYATQVSEQHAVERALTVIADGITARLAAALAV